MGNCVKRKETVILSNTVRLQVPLHTMCDDREEVLNFRVDVSHWKLRGLPSVLTKQDVYFLKAWWSSFEFETTEETGENIKWDCAWQFSFQSTVTDLKANNITVMLFSTKKPAPLATIYIKQWDIATGPSQQNFALADKKGKVMGRISFNAHVRQETMLILRPVSVEVSLNQEKKGRFGMTIKCVTEDSQETLSLPVQGERVWSFDELDGPALSFRATIETLRDASLQAKLWRYKKTNEQVLLAECWLSFSQMFKQEKYTMIKREGPGYKSFCSRLGSEVNIEDSAHKSRSYSVTKTYCEKMNSCGKEVGEISGTVVMMNIPLVSQLISGVNTENGFLAQSSNFLENSMKTPKANTKPTLPDEVVQVMMFTEQLTETFASGDQRENSLFSSRTADVREEINKVKEVCTLLRTSKKQSMISFIYESKGDLLQAQNALLDVGEHFLKFADITQYAVRPFYYEGLIHVVRRGELDLGSLSLTEEDEKQKIKKLPVGIRYRSFLRNVLSCALSKMKVKGVDKKTQQFTEFICAVCYFRVPEYRKVFLSCIKEKTVGLVPEWTCEEDDETQDIQTHILPMFDWQHLFYQFLPEDAEEDTKLRCVLEDIIWKRRVAKRGIAYFRLLAEWATHVRRLFLDRNVPWQEIPGYNSIVKTFLWELKSRQVREYPAVLSLCSCSLLNNPALLSIFVRILFQKTNIYSIETTTESMELLNKWLSQLYDSHRTLPITFDEGYFIEGLKVCLTCDVGMNIAKALWVLYKNYQVFLPRTKEELILKFILGTHRLALGFHWCLSVRQLYWSFVFYRLISCKFVKFDVGVTELDEDIYAKAVDFANKVQSNHNEELPKEAVVYVTYSKSELQRVRDGYDKWLERVQIDLSSAISKTSSYAGLGVFPYPDLSVENVLMDKSENAIQEEW